MGRFVYLFVLSFVSFKMESQFGSSVTCLDVNQDGVLDLVVGAPGFGNSDLDDHNVNVFEFPKRIEITKKLDGHIKCVHYLP